MITTRKRLLSLVLALTMVITLLPHTSFAAEKKEQKQGTEVSTETKETKDTKEGSDKEKEPIQGPQEGLIDQPVGPIEVPVNPQDSGVGSNEWIIEQATNLFEDPDDDNLKIWINQLTPSASNVMMAGETLDYEVLFTFGPILFWKDGGGNQHNYFDHYYDSKVTITLPPGLLLTGGLPAGGAWEDPSVLDDHDLTKSHTYVILLNNGEPIAASNHSIQFTFNVYVGNNGTENSVNTYPLADDFVKVSTNLHILDANGNELNYPNGDPVIFEHSDIESEEDVVTTSPDEWTIKKTPLPGINDGVLDPDANTVTFEYDVEVGLKPVGNEQEGSDWTTDAWYGRHGRNWMYNMTLNDLYSPYLILDGGTEGTSVTATATSATIKKYTRYGNSPTFGEEVDIPSGSLLVWDGDNNTETTTAVKALMMNSGVLVDKDATGPTQLTAKYTKYRVKVVYSIPDEWVAKFPLTSGYKLRLHNKASITATLSPDITQSPSSETDQFAPLPVQEPAKLKISKLFTDYLGNHGPYGNIYGPITFKISSSTAFTVYLNTGTETAPVYEAIKDKNGNSTYSELTGLTVSDTYKYFLAPGTYKLEEDLTPEQENAMDQTDDPTYDERTVPAGYEWDAEFENEETVGSITIIKVDDAGHPMNDTATQQATFQLIKEGETTPFKLATTDGEGKAYFTRVPYGNYTIHESGVPAGYASPGDISVTVSRENAELTYTVTNTQTASRIILHKFVATTQESNEAQNAPSGFGTFTLQRSLDKNTWENVSGYVDMSVGTGGTLYCDVPAFNDAHQAYWYRFEEHIPTGYYNPDDPDADYAYSDPIQLVDETGQHAIPVKDAPEVKMYNRTLMKIHLNKTFYAMQSDGKTNKTDSSKSTTVTLWKTTDLVNVTRVKQPGEADAGQTVSANTYADWTNLPLYEKVGDEIKKITYLITEESVYNYFLDEWGKYENQSSDTNWTMHTIDGVKYIEVPMSSTDGTETMTIWNRENAVPVTIWKKNYYSK